MRIKQSRCSSDFAVELLESRMLLAGGAGVFSDNQDIGSPAVPGSAAYNNGTYTLTAAGTDIGGNSDQFHFAFSQLSGDGSLIANITSLVNTHGLAKAGLMFRSGTSATAAFAGIFVTPTNGITLISRSADGGTAGATNQIGIQAPRFFKLSRVGNQISAYHSPNGATWVQLGSTQTIALDTSALVGLAATSRNVSTATTATFASASVLLPDGWNNNDVGSPTLPGFATFDSSINRFVASGSGMDIGGTSDQFNFTNHSMTGDGSVIALVDPLSGAEPSAKAGVMIRDSLSAGAAFASLARTGQDDLVFQWRGTTGGMAGAVSVANITQPVWLRISQQASGFSAHYSTTGATWTQIGATQTIATTSATTLAGLAVTSHNPAAFAEAAFSGVSIVQEGWSVSPIGSPALRGSATFDAPSNTYALVGGGSGIGGSADQFTFASKPMSGNGTIITYVNSIANTDPAAKAGVMVRSDASVGSAFAGLFITPTGGLVFQWRTSSGAAAQQQTNPFISAPVSLRLTRSGNNFSAAYSTDGLNWVIFGAPQAVVMPSTALAGVAVTSGNDALLGAGSFTGVAIGKNLPPGAGIFSKADELFLHDLSQRSVRFFYDETNPNTGLVPDGSLAGGGSNGSASSIASVGFGLTALTIGDQRGWLTHNEAYQRALTTVNFLWTTAAQVNGFFYHFLNPVTGQRSPGSELSSIDTALLMAGVLNVAQYWPGTPLATVATNVFNRVNWPWMQHSSGQFYGEWRPETGFGIFRYSDFSEAVLLYLLGLGSPTHPTALSSWNSWTRTPVINYGGFTFVTAATRALFTVQYPHAWFDMRGLTEVSGLNYFANSQIATLAQRQMFIDLSGTWPQYGPNNWGATAADGPNGYTIFGGPPPANIDGTIVPTAPGGSLAFTPRRSADALRHMQQTYGGNIYRKYGFVDAFNPHTGWTSAIVLGIDVGMMLIAAENARSNFVWDVFAKHPVSRQALAAAFPSITPSLLGAVSRKPTPSGTSDLPLNLTDGLAIEPRQNGPTQLVLNFGANVVKGPSFNITLSSGAVSSSTTSGSNLTINLSGASDAQTLLVNVSDVRHYPTSASGNYSFNLGVLLADANQDGAVNLNDFNIIAANFGQSPRNFSQGDFTSDEIVNLNDFNLLASQFGKTLAGASLNSSFATRAPVPLAASRFSDEPVSLPTRSDEKQSLIDAISDPAPELLLI